MVCTAEATAREGGRKDGPECTAGVGECTYAGAEDGGGCPKSTFFWLYFRLVVGVYLRTHKVAEWYPFWQITLICQSRRRSGAIATYASRWTQGDPIFLLPHSLTNTRKLDFYPQPTPRCIFSQTSAFSAPWHLERSHGYRERSLPSFPPSPPFSRPQTAHHTAFLTLLSYHVPQASGHRHIFVLVSTFM